MAENTYNGDNGAWETGADWSLGHKPTAGETVVFNAVMTGGFPPANPIAPESVLGLRVEDGDGNECTWSNLTVTGDADLTNTGVTLATLGGRLQLDNAALRVSGTYDSGTGGGGGVTNIFNGPAIIEGCCR